MKILFISAIFFSLFFIKPSIGGASEMSLEELERDKVRIIAIEETVNYLFNFVDEQNIEGLGNLLTESLERVQNLRMRIKEEIEKIKEMKEVEETEERVIISCDATSTSITIDYDYTNISNASLFRESERVHGPASSSTRLGSYTDTGLTPDREYTYYVRSGMFSWSPEVASIKCRTKKITSKPEGNIRIIGQNNSDGLVRLYHMSSDGLSVTSYTDITKMSNWDIKGVYDITNNGNPDVVAQHNDGLVRLYHMSSDGTSVLDETDIGTVGSDWSIRGVTDITGDGNAEVAAQNTRTGEIRIFFISSSGNTILRGKTIGTVSAGNELRDVHNLLPGIGSEVTSVAYVQRESGEVILYALNANADVVDTEEIGTFREGVSKITTSYDTTGSGSAEVFVQHISGELRAYHVERDGSWAGDRDKITTIADSHGMWSAKGLFTAK